MYKKNYRSNHYYKKEWKSKYEEIGTKNGIVVLNALRNVVNFNEIIFKFN